MTRTRNRQSLTSIFVLALMGAIVVAACALEAEPGDSPTEATAGDSALEAAEEVTQDDESVTGDAAAAANGCSIVEWCNEPGANGSVCRQVACSTAAAYAECDREVRQICGAPVCPWVVKTLSGGRTNLCGSGPPCEPRCQ
jgi:hypothetical protein